MCGRYSLFVSPQKLAKIFGLPQVPEFESQYNIAPSDRVPVIGRRSNDKGNACSRLRWGLIPSWADDPNAFNGGLINARVESVDNKPSFAEPFRRRRCIVPASGFFEWDEDGGQPYFFHSSQHDILGFGGIWDTWRGPRGEDTIHSFSILTKPAGDTVGDVHKRMPVVLRREHDEHWLNKTTPMDQLKELCAQSDDAGLETHPVSREVNSPEADRRGLVEPRDA